MSVEDTSPDLFPPIGADSKGESEDGSKDGNRRGLRPRERRALQAVALLCAVATLLSLQWLDEARTAEKNLKPPEKTVTAKPDAIADFLDARWKVLKYDTAQPLGSTSYQGDVTELRLWVGVRPNTAEAARTVGSFGLVYRFTDDGGRHWTALGTVTGKPPQAGVASLITVRGTVPRSKADSLELEIRQPQASRKPGRPLLSLRFER